jgi:NADPH-dependent ferric siderophore reductase
VPLDQSSIDLAARLKVTALEAEIVKNNLLSPSLRAITFRVDPAIAGVPGNDVMVRIPTSAGTFTRRRYSIRSVDEESGEVTIWVHVGHSGPGAAWATTVASGDHVDLVGPRGKIVLDEMADWHLFVGDVASLGSFYRMAESIEVPGRAIFIIELDTPDDGITAAFDEGLGVTGIFVDRQDREGGDATGLLRGLAALTQPEDEGFAYIFGEYHVAKAVKAALLDRGMEASSIALKAFWRQGQVNGDHGEPDKN